MKDLKKPIVNKLRCKKCGDVIESKHSYDWQSCKCGSIFVDGGHDYQRYGWRSVENEGQSNGKSSVDEFIDFSLSVYAED